MYFYKYMISKLQVAWAMSLLLFLSWCQKGALLVYQACKGFMFFKEINIFIPLNMKVEFIIHDQQHSCLVF